MIDSDRATPPTELMPATIQIDPDEGFGPHICARFLECYGSDSVFVTATVDCLTQRFTRALINSGNLSEGHPWVQYGDSDMRESLEILIAVLSAQGLANAPVLLMRSATGYEGPRSFLEAAVVLLGADMVAEWHRLLELEDYAGANSVLATH